MRRWLILAFLFAYAAVIFSAALSFGAELAIGDSIAVGLALPGDAKIGRSPKAVADVIAVMPLARLHGALVILSTGLSNNPSQTDYALLQFTMLHAAGAHVVVIGVGDGVPGAAGINSWLQSEAQARDMGFVWGWPGIHPANYSALLQAAEQLACHLFQECNA